MIRSLIVEGYRGFERFEMKDLGSVNLLVGTNNSGKTSILETVALLASQGDPYRLWDSLSRRGEHFPDETGRTGLAAEVEVRHLFCGHEISPGSSFAIDARSQESGDSVKCTIVENTEEGQGDLFDSPEEFGGFLILEAWSGSSYARARIALSSRGGIALDPTRRWRLRPKSGEDLPRVEFIRTDSISAGSAGALWSTIALAPEEERVVAALRAIDPQIERIAFVGPERQSRTRSRGGFVVKRAGEKLPVPIGSLGDGVWRILGLALAAIRSQGGVLLVDEIDTGLHYTAMEDMWKLVATIARDLDVQVFATTHSGDCVHSLAAICRKDAETETTVSIQRIDPERETAVAYSGREIAVAAKRNIEVR